jgi:hypothetical protein
MSESGGAAGGVGGGATGVAGGPTGTVAGLPCASTIAAPATTVKASAHTSCSFRIGILSLGKRVQGNRLQLAHRLP